MSVSSGTTPEKLVPNYLNSAGLRFGIGRMSCKATHAYARQQAPTRCALRYNQC